jgi:hypothetical protein
MKKILVMTLVLTWSTVAWVFADNNINISVCSPIIGVFDLIPTNNPIYCRNSQELNNPSVAGLSARFTWDVIQPQKNQYNWDIIDNAINRAKTYGKKIILRVTAGINTPEWVYNDGAHYIVFENAVSIIKMPIVWDNIYIQDWCNFIDALGNRYNASDTVASIQMTGCGRLAEMSIYFSNIDWINYGYSIDTYVSAWKTLINTYNNAFPNKIIQIDIHHVLGNQDNSLPEVLDYCLKNYPKKLYVQANDLCEAGSEYSQYIVQAGLSTGIGYQLLGGRNWRDADVGDRMKAFKSGLNERIIYAEVYQSDLLDSSLDSAVRFLAIGLQKNARLKGLSGSKMLNAVSLNAILSLLNHGE